jgi:hypothetical protein
MQFLDCKVFCKEYSTRCEGKQQDADRTVHSATAANGSMRHQTRVTVKPWEKSLSCRGCRPPPPKPEKCAVPDDRFITSFHTWALRTAFRFIKGSQVLQTRVTRPTKLSKHPYFEIHLNTKLAVKTWCRNIKSVEPTMLDTNATVRVVRRCE